jgi:hypothetical protein
MGILNSTIFHSFFTKLTFKRFHAKAKYYLNTALTSQINHWRPVREWRREEENAAPCDCCVNPRNGESFFRVVLLSLCLQPHPQLFNLKNIPGSNLSFPDMSLD